MTQVLYVEGCDGTGKTSVGKAVRDLLILTGRTALYVPIIEGCYTGAEYRKQYLEGKLEGHPTLESLGMLYSVNTTLKTVVESQKDDYDFIIVDRSLASFYTYQIQTNKFTWMVPVFEEVLESAIHGHTLYLTVDPKVALDRILAKRGSLDTVEARGPAYQRLIADSYEECFRQYGKLAPSLRIDVSGYPSADAVALAAVQKLYGDTTNLV